MRGTDKSAGLLALDGQFVTAAERVEALQLCYIPKSEPQRLSSSAQHAAHALYFSRMVLMEKFGQHDVNLLHPLQAAAGATDTFPLASLLSCPSTHAGVLTKLRILDIRDCNVVLVDVRGMASLEVVDLRNNKLQVRNVSRLSIVYFRLALCFIAA